MRLTLKQPTMNCHASSQRRRWPRYLGSNPPLLRRRTPNSNSPGFARSENCGVTADIDPTVIPPQCEPSHHTRPAARILTLRWINLHVVTCSHCTAADKLFLGARVSFEIRRQI